MDVAAVSSSSGIPSTYRAHSTVNVTLANRPLYILNDQDWNKLLPRDVFKKVRENEKNSSQEEQSLYNNHWLKFVVAFNSEEQILKTLSTLKGRNQLSNELQTHKITVLHVAVMRNKLRVVKKLLDDGANPNVQDAYGWTPLHHAVLCSKEIFDCLIAKGADPKAKTSAGGLPEDIERLAGLAASRFRGDISYHANGKAECRMSLDELKSRLNFYYSDECYWPAETLQALWMSRSTVSGSQEIQKLYMPHLKTRPVELVLKEESDRTFGVVAGQVIPPYTLLGEYTGKVFITADNAHQEIENTYSFDLEKRQNFLVSTDGRDVGNLTKYINDGWPNVITYPCHNFKGQPFRVILFACEEVQPDKPLLYDYSHKYYTLKWGRYLLSNREEIRDYYKDFFEKVEQHRKFIEQLAGESSKRPSIEAYLKANFDRTRLLFAFTTPVVLIDLVFSRTLKACDLDDFSDVDEDDDNKKKFLGGLLDNNNLDHFSKIKDLLSDMRTLEYYLNSLSEKQGQVYASHVRLNILKKINTIKVEDLVSLIKYFSNLFDQCIVEDKKLTCTEQNKLYPIMEKIITSLITPTPSIAAAAAAAAVVSKSQP